MKLAILYTSFRQFRELDYLPELFRRSPQLSSTANIIFHCNNGAINPDSLAEKLSTISCRNVELIYSSQKNQGGYPYGQFEAICDVWDKLADKFDWVLHLHPDVFIIHEEPLLAALHEAEADNADMLVTPTFGLKHPSFATDFFAFRPANIPRSVFESYRHLDSTSIVVPLENLFFIEVHRAHIKYSVAQRFAHGHYHRDIDLLGLWHEHDLRRMDLYLKHGWTRWIPTWLRCLCSPYRTARFTVNWFTRKLKGVAQDSLAKQLTAL